MALRCQFLGLTGLCLLAVGCAEPIPVAEETGAPAPASAPSPGSSVGPSGPESSSPYPSGDPSTAGMYDPARNNPSGPLAGSPGFGPGFGSGSDQNPGGSGNASAGGSPSGNASGTVPGNAPASGDPFGSPGGKASSDSDPFAGAAPPSKGQPSSTETPGGTERVKAGVGVGAKGRSLDKYDSGVQRMVAQPARSLFVARERLVLNVQVPQALQLFEALTGNPPKSHEEFMREVIEANNIQLPELRPGQRYLYDPKTKELYVERPATP